MKKILVLLLAIVLSNHVWGAKQEVSELDNYFNEYTTEVILPQLNAWKEFTNEVIPYNENDPLSMWANQELDSLYLAVAQNPYNSIYEQRSLLSRYQTIICTALSYPYVWATMKVAPQPSMVGRNILKSSNENFRALRELGFRSGKEVLKYEGSVYFGFTTYMILDKIYLDADFEQCEGLLKENMDASKFIDNLYVSFKSDVQAFHYGCLIENLSFFKTMQLMIRFAGGKAFYDENEEIYKEVASWMDEQADLILLPLHNNEIDKIDAITSSKFMEIEKQCSAHKVTMINALTQAMLESRKRVMESNKNQSN